MTSRASPSSHHTLQTRAATEPCHKNTKGKIPGHTSEKPKIPKTRAVCGNHSRELIDKCTCECQKHSVCMSVRHRHPCGSEHRHRDGLCDSAAASLWGSETLSAEPCYREKSTIKLLPTQQSSLSKYHYFSSSEVKVELRNNKQEHNYDEKI